MSTTYISVANTAKLIRSALKESFKGVKFSVKSSSYIGGASIRVRWTDGPNAAQVNAVAHQFQGGYFDGSIDYKGMLYHTLDGQNVHFSADFVFVSREYSDAAIERAIAHVVRHYGSCQPITVEDYRQGRSWNWRNSGGCDLGRALSERLSKISDRFETPSATLARVQFAGDDGYGQGTVGRNGNGGDQAAKASANIRERNAAMAQKVGEKIH